MARQAGSRCPRPSQAAARRRELNGRPPLVSSGEPPSTPASAPTLHVPSPRWDETPRGSRPAATRTPGPARATPEWARSSKPLEPSASCSPATPATEASRRRLYQEPFAPAWNTTPATTRTTHGSTAQLSRRYRRSSPYSRGMSSPARRAETRRKPGLDPPATSRCDSGSHDCGLRDGCGPRRDGLGDDRGLGHRVADHTDSPYACCPERHISLLRS